MFSINTSWNITIPCLSPASRWHLPKSIYYEHVRVMFGSPVIPLSPTLTSVKSLSQSSQTTTKSTSTVSRDIKLPITSFWEDTCMQFDTNVTLLWYTTLKKNTKESYRHKKSHKDVPKSHKNGQIALWQCTQRCGNPKPTSVPDPNGLSNSNKSL